MTDIAPVIDDDERVYEFEQLVARDPYQVKTWWAYIQSRPADAYKVSTRSVSDPRVAAVNDAFERCLVHMHKMPVLWLEYTAFTGAQRQITSTRRNFNRALSSLPITQHDLLWPPFLAFVKETGVPETVLAVYRRFINFNPSGRLELASYLESTGAYDAAVLELCALLDSNASIPSRGDVWFKLASLASSRARFIHSVDLNALLRNAIDLYPSNAGRFYAALAEAAVSTGQFQVGRDVYEEALGAVSSSRDLTLIYDAYLNCEEACVTAQLQVGGGQLEPQPEPRPTPTGGIAELELLAPPAMLLDDLNSEDDLNLRMARLESIIDRRPLLLSAVSLRGNGRNVVEWIKFCSLLQVGGATPGRVTAAFEQALEAVSSDPTSTIGKPSDLWIAFASFFESQSDPSNARSVYLKGTSTGRFKSTEDAASLWCAYAEFELRHGGGPQALRALAAVLTPTSTARGAESAVSRSSRLWGLFLDLNEALGTPETTIAAYDSALSSGAATPLMNLNYAAYLTAHARFEAAFAAYERGIGLFPWPHVGDIWTAYLDAFQVRYGGTKLERCRDLFEAAVSSCPPSHAALLYSMYGAMEEAHGSARHAMDVYDRMTAAVPVEQRYEAYLKYIARATEAFGAPRTREIYARALEALPEVQVKDMCMRFARMELSLGEVQRARAIYTYAAQWCDPAVHAAFWATWQEFEAAHGNVDTFSDMLRVKRSVTAAFASSGAARLLASVQAGAVPSQGQASAADEGSMEVDDAAIAEVIAAPPAQRASAASAAAAPQGALQRFQAAAAAAAT